MGGRGVTERQHKVTPLLLKSDIDNCPIKAVKLLCYAVISVHHFFFFFLNTSNQATLPHCAGLDLLPEFKKNKKSTFFSLTFLKGNFKFNLPSYNLSQFTGRQVIEKAFHFVLLKEPISQLPYWVLV